MKQKAILTFFFFCASSHLFCQPVIYKNHTSKEHELVFESGSGEKLRFQFQTEDIIRVQWVQKDEAFFDDNHYEMVENHELSGAYSLKETDDKFVITIKTNKNLEILLQKKPMTFGIYENGKPLIEEDKGIEWKGNSIANNFKVDPNEHFCGLGHQAYGKVESIDLRGKTVSSNYGEGDSDWSAQAVLTVPFYLSSKGYGIFLNSTFHHSFSFGDNGVYKFGIDTKGFKGQMDYYFIYGPNFKGILDNYTQLTGRPRLPQRSMFGLQLSDKGSPDNNGEAWWKEKITNHRKAGFPFDHIVNDNRWRAGTGAWSGSWFEWDSIRYPNPAEYNTWIKENKVTVTLDLNRNTIASCKGWKPEYNLPSAENNPSIKYGNSAPDYTNPDMRNWIWNMVWEQSLNPELNYPGDALWIDETDDLYQLNDSIICANGRSWAENENYYPFLIAKAFVDEGWDNSNNNLPEGIGEAKRPFVWVRSTCAGAQRFASYWSGDIHSDYEAMKYTIRAMQASGLGGFPYFNHDAGGFRDPGPDDGLYVKWAMGMGSFTPIWRPHGYGEYKRWPLDRTEVCQNAALTYGKLRYEMMPYVYSYAFDAHKTGNPMARSMVIDYQDSPEAWQYDLQYMWGSELLVAPSYTPDDATMKIWLPEGNDWYDFWTDDLLKGDQVIDHKPTFENVPLFVKTGSIIPMYKYAQSTFMLDASELILHVYIGANGEFNLYEDDGVSERFRTKNENRITKISYSENDSKLIINPSVGDYQGAPSERSYKVVFHGFNKPISLKLNQKKIKKASSEADLSGNGPKQFWDKKNKLLTVYLGKHQVDKKMVLEK